MKIYLFGKNISVGDKVLLSNFQKECKEGEAIYCGEKVDLSKINNPDEHILIVISNQHLFNLDTTKIVGYVKKDLERPMVVVKKCKTFGAFIYEPNYAIDRIVTNKISLFAGILYIPKKYLKSTISEILKNIDKKELRSYFI